MSEHPELAEIVRVPADLLRRAMDRMGIDRQTHNGHLGPDCPRSWTDWIDDDECSCGRDEDLQALWELLSHNDEKGARG